MRRFALGLAFAVCASQAQAADASDSFRDFCVATHANADRAMAAAESVGWKPAPQALIDSIKQSSGEVQDPQVRVFKDAQGVRLLIAGHGASPRHPQIIGRSCLLVVTPANWSDFAQKISQIADVPAEPGSGNNGAIYVWHEQNGIHVAFPANHPDILTLEKSAGTVLLGLAQKDKSTLMAFFISDGK